MSVISSVLIFFILRFIKLFTKILVFLKFFPQVHKFYLKFFQIWSKIYPIKLPKDFLYLFSICILFRLRENFRKYLLKILINYFETEFINLKIPPSHHLPNHQKVAAWLVHWPQWYYITLRHITFTSGNPMSKSVE